MDVARDIYGNIIGDENPVFLPVSPERLIVMYRERYKSTIDQVNNGLYFMHNGKRVQMVQSPAFTLSTLVEAKGYLLEEIKYIIKHITKKHCE